MELIASTGDGDEIYINDILTGDTIATLRGHKGRINCVSFSPCGTLLATGSRDGIVMLWDCQTWTKMTTFGRIRKFEDVRSVGFSAAAERIVSSYVQGVVIVWSVVSGTTLLRIKTGVLKPYCVCFTSNDTTIAVTCAELVNMYDACTGELMQSLSPHSSDDLIRSIHFSHDGSMMVSAGYDRSVVLSNVASGEEMQTLEGHTYTISEVHFNADASRIVSSSWDGTARIWDVFTGACLLTLTAGNYYVRTCCFSEDGSKVMTADDRGSVKVWDSYTGEELRIIRNGATEVLALSYRPNNMGSYI